MLPNKSLREIVISALKIPACACIAFVISNIAVHGYEGFQAAKESRDPNYSMISSLDLKDYALEHFKRAFNPKVVIPLSSVSDGPTYPSCLMLWGEDECIGSTYGSTLGSGLD